MCQTHAVISEGLRFPSHRPPGKVAFALLATMAPLFRDTDASAQQQELSGGGGGGGTRPRTASVGSRRPGSSSRYTPTRLPDTPLSVSPPAGCLRDVTLTAGRVWGGSGRGWERGRVKFTPQPKSGDRFQTRIQAAAPHRDRRVFPRAVNNGAATLRSVARLALSSRYTKS